MQKKQDTDWFITNRGISSIGVDIVIAGECVKKSLLIPEKVIASYHKKQRDKKDSFEANFVDTVSTTGEKIFYARLEDIYIPEGYIPPNPMTPKEAKLSVKKTYDCIIKFNLSFIGGQEGEGNFTIFFSPLVQRQEGSLSWELTKGKLKTHYYFQRKIRL